MNKEDVLQAIKYLRKYKTETDRLEVKTAKFGFPKKCYDTFSSFSNSHGGLIIFGLSEDESFATEGVYDINDLQKQITDLCSDSMDPVIRPEILALDFEGKNVLAVKIEELLQNQKPCYYKPKGMRKGSYIRVGERDDLMTNYELYSFQSYNDHIFEDTRPTKRAFLEDLKSKELKTYIEKVKSNKPHFAINDFEKCLRLCGIIDANVENIYPTLAGTMIFGEYPQSFYPQLFVACVVVPGVELGDKGPLGERFIDNKRVEGTIEEMLNETINFLRRNMKTSVIINSDGKRTNRTEYPLDALREAVANALIHRDYSIYTENSYISVYMYEDRIEIINPGGLYGINKLERIETISGSETRNPTIVRILEEKGSVIENRHTGIPTMKREMKAYGLPEPEFYTERNCFKVVFRNNMQAVQESGQQKPSGQQNKQESGQQNKQESGQQNKQESGHQKPSRQQKLDLETYKKEVLEFCISPKTAKEIKELLNIKSRQYISAKIIRPLINEGKLEYTNTKNIKARNQKYKTTF